MTKRLHPLAAEIIKGCVPAKKELSAAPFFKAKGLQNHINFFLVCEKKRGVERFVFDMLSEWLLPGKRLDITVFQSISFKGPDEKNYIGIKASLNADKKAIFYHIPFLSQQIKFGVSSYYQGMQILELKGSEFEEVAISLQLELKALIRRFPMRFDYDIYPLMRQMALALSSDYKKERSRRAILRALLMFYALRREAKEFKGGRFIQSRLSVMRIKKHFEERKVIGVALSVSIRAGREAFEMKHFAALMGEKMSCPFEFVDLDTGMKQFYCEVEGSRKDLVRLRDSIKARAPQFIQPLARPVFMPRNEEEVMKSLVTLSRQIRLSNDIPQVMIQFDRQTEDAAIFRVLMVRPLKKKGKTGLEIIGAAPVDMKIAIERMRKVGMLQRKISKEALVFTTEVVANQFLRTDGSLDLFRARHFVFEKIEKIFGQVRDFNGAMMGQQMAKLESIKSKVKGRELQQELEHFFFSLHPVEFRAMWEDEIILEFFHDFLKWKKGEMVDLNSFFASFNTEEEGMKLFESLKKEKAGAGAQALFVKSSFLSYRVVGLKTNIIRPDV